LNPLKDRDIYKLPQLPGSILASQWLSFSRLVVSSAKAETFRKSKDRLKSNSCMAF